MLQSEFIANMTLNKHFTFLSTFQYFIYHSTANLSRCSSHLLSLLEMFAIMIPLSTVVPKSTLFIGDIFCRGRRDHPRPRQQHFYNPNVTFIRGKCWHISISDHYLWRGTRQYMCTVSIRSEMKYVVDEKYSVKHSHVSLCLDSTLLVKTSVPKLDAKKRSFIPCMTRIRHTINPLFRNSDFRSHKESDCWFWSYC